MIKIIGISILVLLALLEIINLIQMIIDRAKVKIDIRKVVNYRNKATVLKACPFCGSERSMDIFTDTNDTEKPHHFCITCDVNQGGCGISTGFFITESLAVEAWNMRDGICDTKWEDADKYHLINE